VHLVFSTGHSAPIGEQLVRSDLLDGALDLARLLHRLLPDDREVTALLALVLLIDARRESRVSTRFSTGCASSWNDWSRVT